MKTKLSDNCKNQKERLIVLPKTLEELQKENARLKEEVSDLKESLSHTKKVPHGFISGIITATVVTLIFVLGFVNFDSQREDIIDYRTSKYESMTEEELYNAFIHDYEEEYKVVRNNVIPNKAGEKNE